MKTPEELAQEGRVVEAFDSILTQEVPVSTLALSPEELAQRGLVKEAYEQMLGGKGRGQGGKGRGQGGQGKGCSKGRDGQEVSPSNTPEELAQRGLVKAAYETILTGAKKPAEPMKPEDFVKALEGKLQIKDRRVKTKASGDTVYLNFYNLPKSVDGGAGGGAEAENNRMMFVIRFKDEGAKAKIEHSVNALDRKYNLRAKTAHPSKIVDYLAAHLAKVVKEAEPNLTHSRSAAELAQTDPGAAFDMILAAGPKDQGRLAFWRVQNALKKMGLKPSESKTKGGVLGPYPYVAVFEAESFDRPAAEKKLKAFVRKHKAWSYKIKIGKPSVVEVTFKPIEEKTACGDSCNGNCECQGDCNPVALVEAGHVKAAYEAILADD